MPCSERFLKMRPGFGAGDRDNHDYDEADRRNEMITILSCWALNPPLRVFDIRSN